MANTTKDKDDGIRLDVHGWGSSAAMPDYFSVHFEVRAEHSDEDICFDTASKEAEKLLKAINGWKNESDSVSTSSFSFSHYMATREYSRWPQGQMITVVSTTVYVESGRVDDMSYLVSLARKNGASKISDVEFRLSDSLKKSEREKALTLASGAALYDAEVTARAFGVSVEGVVSVDILNGYDRDTYSDRYVFNENEGLCLDGPSFYGDEERVSDIICPGKVVTSVGIEAVFRLSK